MLIGQLHDRRTRVFWTLAAGHLINDSYVFFLLALLPLLIPSLDISLTAAGLAVGLYQITSSVTQPFLGHLADRYPLRWMVWVGLATVSDICAGMPWIAALIALTVRQSAQQPATAQPV